MALITFTKAGETGWSPSKNPSPPRNIMRNLNQVSQESAGGTVFTYTKGAHLQYHVLRFRYLTATDKSTLITFFDDVAIGRKISFTYTDDGSTGHTVFFNHSTLDWEEETPHTHLYHIELMLREAV